MFHRLSHRLLIVQAGHHLIPVDVNQPSGQAAKEVSINVEVRVPMYEYRTNKDWEVRRCTTLQCWVLMDTRRYVYGA